MKKKFCTQCGEPMEKKFLFCGNCGKELSSSPPKKDKPLISSPEGNVSSSSIKETASSTGTPKYIVDGSGSPTSLISSLRFLPHLFLVIVFWITYEIIKEIIAVPNYHTDLPTDMAVFSFVSASIVIFLQFKFPSRFIFLSAAVIFILLINSIIIYTSYREWMQFQQNLPQSLSESLNLMRSFIFICAFFIAGILIAATQRRKNTLGYYSHQPREAR